MARKRVTKTEKLLNEVKKRGSMSHKDIVKFLLRGTGNDYNSDTRTHYDSMLYGTSSRDGIFDTRLFRNDDGTYSV